MPDDGRWADQVLAMNQKRSMATCRTQVALAIRVSISLMGYALCGVSPVHPSRLWQDAITTDISSILPVSRVRFPAQITKK